MNVQINMQDFNAAMQQLALYAVLFQIAGIAIGMFTMYWMARLAVRHEMEAQRKGELFRNMRTDPDWAKPKSETIAIR